MTTLEFYEKTGKNNMVKTTSNKFLIGLIYGLIGNLLCILTGDKLKN